MKKYFATSSIYPTVEEPTTQQRSVPDAEENAMYHRDVVTNSDGTQLSVNKVNIMGAFFLLAILLVILHLFK